MREKPGKTGIDAGKLLRNRIVSEMTVLIYVSAHKEYLYETSRLNTFYFLSKPIVQDEFNAMMDWAVRHVTMTRELTAYTYIPIMVDRATMRIPTRTVMYLESKRREIYLHTQDHVYTYYGRLGDTEKELPEQAFIRIHQSYIINFAYVKSVTQKSVTMGNGERLTISIPYRDKIVTAYMKYRGEIMWRL